MWHHHGWDAKEHMPKNEYVTRDVDGAGIEWETRVVDPTHGVYIRTRITPHSSKACYPHRKVEVRGRSAAFIHEVPADMEPVTFMSGWLSSNAASNSRSAAVESLKRQFPKASEEEVERAAMLYARGNVSLA
ncbi:MAG: hypothetical protein HC900_03410 [Methylacidiphilales bacterium]|nr:hypothetical protein [Candidatus Methylacidiphilales bacterium]